MHTHFLQEMIYIGRVRYWEVSSRGLCEWGPKNDVHYRDESAIKDVRYNGVSLYFSVLDFQQLYLL